MKRFLLMIILLNVNMTVTAPYVFAQSSSAKPAAKKAAPTSKTPKSKTAKAKKTADSGDEESEPDITGSISVDFQCELGNKLTIYENAADDKHIALRWNKRLHRLTRVDTSTGANRFENRRYGLVWIGIPAKGMLLDSKKGRQLANECKNAEQMNQKAVITDRPGMLSTPAVPTTPPPPGKPES
jgi:hypothetical protein